MKPSAITVLTVMLFLMTCGSFLQSLVMPQRAYAACDDCDSEFSYCSPDWAECWANCAADPEPECSESWCEAWFTYWNDICGNGADAGCCY